MTNQELNNKVDELYNECKYEEIIPLLENLPENEQTYHLMFMLAASYSYLSDLSDDDYNTYYHKAIKILMKISDQGENDIKWLYIMGRTYFNAGVEECAIEYFEKINHICEKTFELDNFMNLAHFIEKCKECLYERTLAVVFVTLEGASHDKDLTVELVDGNKIKLYFPKYNIRVFITINELRRSGAKLDFNIYYPDNAEEVFSFEGFGHTFENGITDALNRFIAEVNNNLKLHYKNKDE